ncbi:MAG: hypothetical protein CL920_10175 [Deltaproteobacteria bacterium]|nr:hypothetical protein [Deltaproteobacteria bacterium]
MWIQENLGMAQQYPSPFRMVYSCIETDIVGRNNSAAQNGGQMPKKANPSYVLFVVCKTRSEGPKPKPTTILWPQTKWSVVYQFQTALQLVFKGTLLSINLRNASSCNCNTKLQQKRLPRSTP